MNNLVKHIVFSCLLFGAGFITGLNACTQNTRPIVSTVAVEHHQQEVSSRPDVKVEKKQDYISVSQTLSTSRYGKITAQSVFPRKTFAYNHCLAVNAFALNSEVLLGLEYRYKNFKIHALAGYNYQQQSLSYGLGIGYVIKAW